MTYVQETLDRRGSAEFNLGAPEFKGRVELGSEQRKVVPGVAKLNDPEHGLFGVAEGRGSERVASLVAKDLVSTVAQDLGASLDRQIQNNLYAAGSMDERIARVDALVESKLKEIFLPTIAKVRSRSVVQKEFDHAGLRASIAKLVDLPHARKRLYLSHLGDARVYLLRGERLTQMTQDDTGLTQQMHAGFLSSEDFEQIDQSRSPSELSHEHQQLFPLRHDVVSVTGRNSTRITPEVDVYDVQRGDRLVIVNGTVQSNLTTRDIQNWVSTLQDDLQAEDVLQRSADDEAGKKTTRPGRAEAGDLAAVVHTI